MHKFLTAIAAAFIFSTSFYVKSDAEKTNKVAFSSAKSAVIAPLKVVATKTADANSAEEIYSGINFNSHNKLNSEVFKKAYTGFTNLKNAGKLNSAAHLLTIADFSLSSNVKRLWIIDLDKKEILFNTLVAHGKNTGEEFATNFSNTESSLQSSMGFYITHETYTGENGYSLKLEGVDEGYNDAALRRAIVMHGADYVSEDFARQHQRIGRSWGCPAVPRALAEPIINTVKGESCLFIYYPDENYLASSRWLKS